MLAYFFFQAEDGIRDLTVTGVQTCALPIYRVPERFAEFAFLIRGARGMVEEEVAGDAETGQDGPPGPRLGKRRNAGAIEAGEHDRPYDTPLLGGLVPRGAAGRAARAGQAAAAAGSGTVAETAAQAGVPAHRS